MIDNKKEYVLHYEDVHPIMEVKNFVDIETAHQIIEFLDLNDDQDNCWGAVCFREYWEKHRPDLADELPKTASGIDKNILNQINDNIFLEAVNFLNDSDIVFSKFKGHNHIENSYSPPHGWGPGVIVGILSLNNDYSGGNFFIEDPLIEMRFNERSLYLFREGGLIKHGVREITNGRRLSLVSHWQRSDSPYSGAGSEDPCHNIAGIM